MTLPQRDRQCRLGFSSASQYNQVPLDTLEPCSRPIAFQVDPKEGLRPYQNNPGLFWVCCLWSTPRREPQMKTKTGTLPLGFHSGISWSWAQELRTQELFRGDWQSRHLYSDGSTKNRIEFVLGGKQNITVQTPSCLLEHEALAPPIVRNQVQWQEQPMYSEPLLCGLPLDKQKQCTVDHLYKSLPTRSHKMVSSRQDSPEVLDRGLAIWPPCKSSVILSSSSRSCQGNSRTGLTF